MAGRGASITASSLTEYDYWLGGLQASGSGKILFSTTDPTHNDPAGHNSTDIWIYKGALNFGKGRARNTNGWPTGVDRARMHPWIVFPGTYYSNGTTTAGDDYQPQFNMYPPIGRRQDTVTKITCETFCQNKFRTDTSGANFGVFCLAATGGPVQSWGHNKISCSDGGQDMINCLCGSLSIWDPAAGVY